VPRRAKGARRAPGYRTKGVELTDVVDAIATGLGAILMVAFVATMAAILYITFPWCLAILPFTAACWGLGTILLRLARRGA
jgi:hypothetical protein